MGADRRVIAGLDFEIVFSAVDSTDMNPAVWRLK
jgi:hypothetical protein